MTQKHFIAVAAAFKSILDNAVAPGQSADRLSQHTLGFVAGVESAARQFARVAASDNPRFDTRQFLRACGINN